jgi:hypothetical protein
MATYFWGLLGMDGCIQMFGGVMTWLLLLFFHCLPIIFSSIWWDLFCLIFHLWLVKWWDLFCLIFHLWLIQWWDLFCLIFHLWLVQWWDLFCILNLCDIVQLFCILNLYTPPNIWIQPSIPRSPQKYVAMFPHTLLVTIEHLNTTINPKESPKICSHVPPYTTCHHRTLTPLSVILNSPHWDNLTTSSGTEPAH